jgi:hypothetical protein
MHKMVNIGYLEENHQTVLDFENKAKEAYEQRVKPLLDDKKYAEASRALKGNRAVWSYLSKEELIAMVDFYQNYAIPKLVRTIFEEMRMDSLQKIVMKEQVRDLGVTI